MQCCYIGCCNRGLIDVLVIKDTPFSTLNCYYKVLRNCPSVTNISFAVNETIGVPFIHKKQFCRNLYKLKNPFLIIPSYKYTILNLWKKLSEELDQKGF